MMRFQISTIAVAAFLTIGMTAFAGPATSSRGSTVAAPHAAVIAIMKDAGQALLWDGDSDEYVVVRRGDRFQDCSVSSIEQEQVVLTRERTNEHFILPRTSDTSNIARKSKGRTLPPARDTQRGHSAAWDPTDELQDPYPSATTMRSGSRTSGVLLDPYGTSGPIATVSARKATKVTPIDPYASSTKKSALRVSVTPATSAPLDPYGSAPGQGSTKARPIDPYGAISASRKPTVTAPLDPYGGTTTSHKSTTTAPLDPYAKPSNKSKKGKVVKQKHAISRREFDAAVTDFHSLSKEVKFSIVSEGVRINGIGRGSRFHRWGFRDNDTILSVDGKYIKGVDDAAAVYAHLMDAKRFKVKITRGVDTVVMHFRFKK